MKRKTAAELEQSGNKAAAKKRRKQELLSGPGVPARPPCLPRATRNAWNNIVEEYRQVLHKTDGKLLLEMIEARAEQYRGAGERKLLAAETVKEIESRFIARTAALAAVKKPALSVQESAIVNDLEKAKQKAEQKHIHESAVFSDLKTDKQEQPHISLAVFLESTQMCRDTFSDRLVPAQTMMLDESGPFTWDPADPTTRAREYAQQCVQGAVPSCDLAIRACARFLDDLEHGHERGIYFDPIAARQIITFFTVFLKRPPFRWQLLMLVNVFGFRLPSGLRRFKESWCWISRQNGKTALNAGIGNFILIADGEPVSEIYAAANTGDQSKITFRDAKRLIKHHPELKEHVKAYRSALTIEDTDACFLALASETSSLDGLRPACLLADEIHEWDAAVGGRELWSKLTSGMVSRRHPLTLAISTSGSRQMGFAWEKFELIKKILHKVIVADDIWCCAWELDPQDDYRDEKLWIKANPSLADEKGLTLDSLRRQFRETQADPSSLSSFLRYQCGRWQEFKRNTSTFSFAKIDGCRGFPNLPHATPQEMLGHFLEHNVGLPCYAGFDYGEVSDLACLALLYPRVTMSDGTVYPSKVLLAEFWTPSALVQQHQKEWGVPLEQWIRDGWVHTCDGDMNDSRQLTADLKAIVNAKRPVSDLPQFNIRSIYYDAWHSRSFMAAFSEETSIPCIEIKQFASTITPLAVAFKTAVLSGQLWILDNPVIRWMLGNVILERTGKYDAITADKPSKHAKIDAVQAGLGAWAAMEQGAPSERAPRLFFMENQSGGPDMIADGGGGLKALSHIEQKQERSQSGADRQ